MLNGARGPRRRPVRAGHLAQPLQPRPQGDLPAERRPLVVARLVRGALAGGGPPPSPHRRRRAARPALRLRPDGPARRAVAAPDPRGAPPIPNLPEDASTAAARLLPPGRPAGALPGHPCGPDAGAGAGADSGDCPERRISRILAKPSQRPFPAASPTCAAEPPWTRRSTSSPASSA